MTAVDLSVVLPVYATADFLIDLHGRLTEALASTGLAYEVVFVDDSSPDDAHRVLVRLADADESVRLVLLVDNRGQQQAILEGLRSSTGRMIAVMDSDLQDPPEALPRLVAHLDGGWDAVFAGRRGRYESTTRLLSSRIFKWLVHAITGVPRDAGSYVVMTRRMAERVLAFGDEDAYLVGMIGATGLPCDSIAVERAPRMDGASAYTTGMRFSVAARAVRRLLTTWRN